MFLFKKMSRQVQVSIVAAAMGATVLSGVASAARVAPYFYMWGYGNSSSYKITSLMDAQLKTRVKEVILAFAIGGGGSCTLGNDSLPLLTASTPFAADIKKFIGLGNHVTMSFGGANGPYLEQGCTSPAELAGTIKKLIDALGITSIDFDVEGAMLPNQQMNDLRNKAIVALQKQNPNISVAFTLPVLPSGLTQDGINLVKGAAAAGVKIRTVNIMAMDYGAVGGTPGDNAISALTKTHDQLVAIFPTLTDASIWGMLGVTPMIGNNDNGDPFMPADAVKLTNFAKQKNINLISYWAFQRDQVGQGGLATSSMQNQSDFQYFKIFSGATSDVPNTSSGTTSSSSGTSTSSSGTTTSSSGSTSSSSSSSSSGTGGCDGSSGSVNPDDSFVLDVRDTDKKKKGKKGSTSWNTSTNCGKCRLWAEGVTYKVGEVVSYNGSTYTVLQGHTAWAGVGWRPPVVPALWTRGGTCTGQGDPEPGKGCKHWKEGGTYPAGTVVRYQKKNFTSLVTHTAYAGTNWTPLVAITLWQAGGTCKKQPGDSSSSGSSSTSSSGTVLLGTSSSGGSSSSTSTSSGSGSSSSSTYPTSGTGGWGDIDLKTGKDKIVANLADIKAAAAQNGIDWHDLAAIILQEGRGLSGEQMRAAGGIAQIGLTEITALKNGSSPADGSPIKPHPELLAGGDTDYASPHNQIFGAAAYLAFLKGYAGGDMDKAINMYNKGINISAGLGDPAYMQNHKEALAILKSFNIG